MWKPLMSLPWKQHHGWDLASNHRVHQFFKGSRIGFCVFYCGIWPVGFKNRKLEHKKGDQWWQLFQADVIYDAIDDVLFSSVTLHWADLHTGKQVRVLCEPTNEPASCKARLVYLCEGWNDTASPRYNIVLRYSGHESVIFDTILELTQKSSTTLDVTLRGILVRCPVFPTF